MIMKHIIKMKVVYNCVFK